MKRTLLRLLILKLAGLCLVGTCWAQLARVSQMATAIARTEGFYVKGSLPNRLGNPGDIRARSTHAYAGQQGLYHGYVVFRSDAWGWAALEKQIESIIEGTSGVYNQEMTFYRIAKRYASDPRWARNVCKILRISPRETFAEFFELPPRVRISCSTQMTALLPLMAK
jgi:hypothetical protein